MSRDRSAKQASFIAISLIVAGCGSPPKPRAAPVEEAPIDLASASSSSTPTNASGGSGRVPHELAGVTLGVSPKSLKGFHPTHAPGVGFSGFDFSWYAPKKNPKIEDATPQRMTVVVTADNVVEVDTHFAGEGVCKMLRDALPARYGAPTSKRSPPGFDFYDWVDGSVALRFGLDFAGSDIDTHGCDLSLTDDMALGAAKKVDPTMGNGVDHFGGAKLGASKSSFQGMTLKEKTADGEWWTPSKKSYHGIALNRLTYKFQNDVLVNVGFDVAKFADCPKLAAQMKSEYGKPADTSTDAATAYEWTGSHAALKFTSSTITKNCGGILYGGDSSLASTPAISPKSSAFDMSHDPNSGFNSDTGDDRFGTSSPSRYHVSQ